MFNLFKIKAFDFRLLYLYTFLSICFSSLQVSKILPVLRYAWGYRCLASPDLVIYCSFYVTMLFNIVPRRCISKPWISHYDVYVIPIIWPIKCNLQKTVIMAITFYLCRSTAVDNRSELLFRFMELRKQWQKINKEDYFACLPSNTNCCFLLPILPCYCLLHCSMHFKVSALEYAYSLIKITRPIFQILKASTIRLNIW